MGHFRNSQCSHDIKKIRCRNYVARTRLSRKSLSSVKRTKCRIGENERNFPEIQYGREKSTGMEDISYVMVAKERKKAELFLLYNAAMKQISFWKRLRDVVGCLDVRLLYHFKVIVQRLHAALLQLFSCHHLNFAFFT